MGDDAFTTQEFGTQTVYTLKMDNTKFAARMLKYGMMEDLTSFVSTMESLAGGMGGKIELPKINYEIVFKVDSGKLTDSSMKGSIKIAGAVPTEINFDAKGNTAAATSSLEVKGRYFGKISMTAKTTMKQTNKEPRITPPEGAKVYTLDELYAG